MNKRGLTMGIGKQSSSIYFACTSDLYLFANSPYVRAVIESFRFKETLPAVTVVAV